MAGQSVLVQISIVYCMVHMYFILLLFYEYRCSRRTFFLTGGVLFAVTSGACLWLLFTRGVAAMGQYAGDIAFDRSGIPVTDKPGHGIGTRSIVAFAEKYRALYLFQAENGWFKLQIAI